MADAFHALGDLKLALLDLGDGTYAHASGNASTNKLLLPVLTVAGAYTAGDCFGTLLTVANAARVAGASIRVEAATLTDKSDQAGAFTLLLFAANPTLSTFTDNSAPAIDETVDLQALAGAITIAAGDWIDVGAARVATVAPTTAGSRLPFSITLATTSLYVVVLAQNTLSYTAGDVQVRLHIRQD